MVTEPTHHPDWDALGSSWELSLQAEGFSKNSVETNLHGLRKIRDWATANRDGAGPFDLTRTDVRSWMAWMLEIGAASSARRRFDTNRKFYAWCVDEGETDTNPFDGLRGPVPNKPRTPTVKPDQLKALRDACGGRDLRERRDRAIIDVFVDTGIRLDENAGLALEAVDLKERMIYVSGKGSKRRGPKRRAVAFGLKTAQSIDRYLRERRKIPGVAQDAGPLWVTTTGAPLSRAAVRSLVKRRGEQAGIPDLHAHQLRHTWASASRKAGLSDGNLAYLGGWSNRAMLDRYGEVEAEERAIEAYRNQSVLDQL
jgi:integrase/recombinase XerC